MTFRTISFNIQLFICNINVFCAHGSVVCLYVFLLYDYVVQPRTCLTCQKPLSHQGGAITAFYKNAERRVERGTNATNAVAARWHRKQTPREILERQGSAFRLNMLKTYAVAWRYNKTHMEEGANNAWGLVMVGGSQNFTAWSFSQTDARAEIRGYF